MAQTDQDIRRYFKNIFGIRIEKLAEQAVENVEADVKTVKIFENGQLVIIKNGVRYNALGAAL